MQSIDGGGHEGAEGFVVDLVADGVGEHDNGNQLSEAELEPDNSQDNGFVDFGQAGNLINDRAVARKLGLAEPDQHDE